MGFREYLIALNILAFVVIAGVIVWRVLSIRRNPEPETPRNVTPWLVGCALRESERLSRSTLDALTAHIAILDQSATILAVNASGVSLQGHLDEQRIWLLFHCSKLYWHCVQRYLCFDWP